MTNIIRDFEDEADFDLRTYINVAYAMAGPEYDWDPGTAQFVRHYVEVIYNHFHSKLECKDRAAIAQLPYVSPLDEQIALDRRRFQTLTQAGEIEAREQMDRRRQGARVLLETLKNHPDLADSSKLMLINNVREHLYLVAVYMDRLANTPASKIGDSVPRNEMP